MICRYAVAIKCVKYDRPRDCPGLAKSLNKCCKLSLKRPEESG